MAHALSNLVIKEISLVDDGDNPEARVAFVKRRGGEIETGPLDVIAKGIERAMSAGGADGEAAGAVAFLKGLGMDIEALNKRLGEIEGELATITKRAEDAEAEVTKLKGEATVKDAEIEKLKGSDDAGEDAVLKALPEAARAILTKARDEAAAATAAIAKMADDTEKTTFIAKARAFGIGVADEVGGLLHRIAKGKTTDTDVAAVETLLKQAATISKESSLFKSVGSDIGGDGANPEAVLKSAAEAIQKAKPGITFAKAYQEAMDANPAVYADYVTKSRAKRAG